MKNNVILMEIDKPLYETIHSVQYDRNSRFLHVKLLNNSLPFDLTNKRVILSGSKPDGQEIFNTCKIEEGLVVIEITEEMNAIPGTSKYNLEIYGGDMSLLQTKNFKIRVTPSNRSKAIESRSEVKALNDLISEVQNIDNRFAKTDAKLSEVANKGTTVEVLERVTKEEIDRKIEDGTIANLTIAEGSITKDKLDPNIKFGIEDGEVTNRKLAKESVTKEKIKDGEITPAKLSDEILVKEYGQGFIDIFNKDDIEEGYIGIGNGNVQKGSNPSDRTSGFIEVVPDTEYKRNPQGSIATGNRTIGFYASNKVFLKCITFNRGEYIFTTPANCKYIRFVFSMDDIELEYIHAPSPSALKGYKLKPSFIGDEAITLEKLSSEIVEYVKGNNLFNKNEIEEGYVNNSNGTLVSASNPSDRASGFIEVASNTKYKRNPEGTISHSAKSICFYDENKIFISGVRHNVGEYTFTTPSNCKYIRFSLSVEDLDIEYICLESEKEITLSGYKINKDLLPSNLGNNSNNNSSSVENMGETGLMTKAMFNLDTNTSKYKQGMVSPDGTEHVISVTNDGEFIAIPKVHFDFPKEYGFTVTGRSLVNDEMYICGPRTKFIAILNSKGYVKWYKPLKIGGYNFRKLTSDKGEIRYLYADKNGKSQVATNGGFTYNDLVIMNDKFVELKRVALLASGSIADGFPMEDHDYIYFNDDHYIIPTYHPNVVTNVPNTNNARCKVLNCVLQEIKNGKVVFHWESINHPEFYTLSHFNNNFTAYHENQNIYNDYMHINSFVIDKRDGNLLVSARHIGFFKINRTTGELMWVIGKNRCDFSGVTANMIPSMQHDAKYNYDNSITLYDNSGCPTDNARICRYWLDEENLKLEKFKEYITPYKRSPHMGGATLIDDDLELFDISFGGDPGTFPVGWHEYSFKYKKEYLNYKHDNKNMFYRIFRNEKYGRQE